MKRKRPYLLLELMIALTIVSLCSIPLMRYPMYCLQTQLTLLKEGELERLAEESFAEIKEAFYKNEVPIDKIKEGKEKFLYKTAPVNLSFGKTLSQSFEKRYYLRTHAQKTGKNLEDYFLVYVDIVFAPLPLDQVTQEDLFTFRNRVFIKSLP